MPQMRNIYDHQLNHLMTSLNDPIAQINHQAFGSHAIVDSDFDHVDEIDLLDHNGRFNHLYEMTNA